MAGLRRNIIGSAYLAGASLVSQLTLVPVFLHYWGAQSYGWWLVLFTMPAFFVFADAGLSNTVGNAVTLDVEQSRPAEAQAKLNAAWKFQGIAWALLFGVLGLLLAFFPVRGWLGVAELPVREFVPAVLLLCLYSLVALQTGMLSALYRAGRCYPNYLAWNAHARVLETVLVVATLACGGRFVAVAAAMFFARVIGALALYSRGRRLLPEVHLALFAGRWGDLAPLLPSGLAFLSFPVANALINQGTVLVVNHLAGAPAVVLLSVCRQLARVFQQGTSIVLTAFQPEMTTAYGTRNRERVRQLQSLALVLPLAVAVPFVAGTTLWGSTVIQWWTRKDLGATWPLLLACGLEAVAFGCGTLCSLVPWSINRVRGLSIVYAVSNAIGLLLAGVGLARAGLAAVPLAFFAAGVAYCFMGLKLGCQLGAFTLRALFVPREFFSAAAQWRARWT